MIKQMLKTFITNAKGNQAPLLNISELYSYSDYKNYVNNNKHIIKANHCFEKKLSSNNFSEFILNSYCYVCRKNVDFVIDYKYSYEIDGILTPNWRERLICPYCGLNNRMRAVVNVFDQICQPIRMANILITEQTTDLYKIFKQLYPNTCGCEYLEDSIECGNINHCGIRNEDLTDLSFDKEVFDYILSFDVLEHIPNYKKGLAECYRCLKSNGVILFTIPFVETSEKNIVRANLSKNGEITHYLPAEYHGNPLSSDGCLCFYHFGWEVLDDLKRVGFKDAKALVYWSKELGYLGGNQLIFIATKPNSTL